MTHPARSLFELDNPDSYLVYGELSRFRAPDYAQGPWPVTGGCPRHEIGTQSAAVLSSNSLSEFDAFYACALYRHYDNAGTLLYVGISSNPKRRWDSHCNTSPWVFGGYVAWVELTWYPTRKKASTAEVEVIARDRPLWNQKRRRGCLSTEFGNRQLLYRNAMVAELAAFYGNPIEVAQAVAKRAAVELGTLRRVRCRVVPGTTCVSCGPDAEELYT